METNQSNSLPGTSNQPRLLSRAAKVLKTETLIRAKKAQEINRYGMAILDRWALNQPEELQAVEAKNPVYLLMKVLEQQYLEQEILERPENQERLQNGLTPQEILTENGAQTSLTNL